LLVLLSASHGFGINRWQHVKVGKASQHARLLQEGMDAMA
jgi:hypothetical protein